MIKKERDNAHYMELALQLASKAGERTYPNPMVGAVIVKAGRIIGKGYHIKAGRDHAEVAAIKNVKGSCRGADLYVTLEPCDHFGKTPPCTEAIIGSGIKKVYAAITDPNPQNNGRGIKKLRANGIKVVTGMCAARARALNRKYIKSVTRGLPYVTLKLGQSLDGKIAASDGSSRWVTSKSALRYTRRLRRSFDAICVGYGTLVKDDPLLLDGKKNGTGTKRIIVDTRLGISLGSNILRTAGKAPVIIGTTDLAPGKKLKKISSIKNVEIIKTRRNKGMVDLTDLFMEIASRGVINILVEGGGRLAGSLLDEGLIDEILFIYAPKLLGGSYSSIKGRGAPNINKAFRIKDMDVRKIGADIIVKGYVCSRV